MRISFLLSNFVAVCLNLGTTEKRYSFGTKPNVRNKIKKKKYK